MKINRSSLLFLTILSSTANAERYYICLPCERGEYSENSVCRKCPVGYYTDTKGSSSCKPCPAGTYSNTLGATSCAKCPTGTYSNAGATTCTPCPAGSYAPNEGTAYSCPKCPAGSICPSTGLSAPTQECSGDNGWWAPEGSTSCRWCGYAFETSDSDDYMPFNTHFSYNNCYNTWIVFVNAYRDCDFRVAYYSTPNDVDGARGRKGDAWEIRRDSIGADQGKGAYALCDNKTGQIYIKAQKDGSPGNWWNEDDWEFHWF